MRDQAQDLRDRVVRMLARLSLIAVLALMGALFVGSTALGGTDEASTTQAPRTEQNQDGVLDDARPTGLVLGAVAVGGGMAVLMVGAFRPAARPERELAELRRR